MALVLWVGVTDSGFLVSPDISLGTLIAFVLLLQRFFVPIMTLGNEWQTVQAALAGLERIFQVLALPAETVPSSSQGRPESDAISAIELREVSFGYLPGLPMVRRVTLEVRPGEHVALV